MNLEELRKKLDEKIPRDVISLRDGGGNRKLSYLEGWYVIDRLNQVLGQGNWAYVTEEMRLVHEGEGPKGGFVAHYIARVRLEVPGLGHCIFVDYGYGDGSDKFSPGKAHELAVKEAVTDAVKRCAKNLGMSMGLALYDKTQENVDDGEAEPAPAPRAVAQAAPKPAPIGKAAPVQAAVPSSAVSEAAPEDRDQLNQMISSMAKVAMAKKLTTANELRKQMKDKWGKDAKEDLTDAEAKQLYAELRGMIA